MQYLLNITYKGTHYAGWQRQANAVTVQEKIEDALTAIYKAPVSITGASRTDAGVHAIGQKCCFAGQKIHIPTDKLPYAINSRLPEDIAVTWAKEVADSLHPIFSAKNKTYVYSIYNGPFRNPLIADFSWHVPLPLDIGTMAAAAKDYVGRHDFSAFCASASGAKTHVRLMNSASVYEEDGLIRFEINGAGFLYNMVRIMAGTLVYIGCGKIHRNGIPAIILSKSREMAGITAPPQGLCLKEVYYS